MYLNKLLKNKMFLTGSSFWLVLGLIVLVLIGRFLPHPPNFTPLLSVALFAGAVFARQPMAWLVPLLALYLSDLFLGLHGSMVFVYVSVLAIVFFGQWLASPQVRLLSVLAISFLASLFFYLLTNFGVWLLYDWYPPTMAGLMASYLAALPFFIYTLASTCAYSLLLFGLRARYRVHRATVQTAA
jgi:hypothetical protein